jgi:DNA-binding FrmR family transcriptional regulator
MLSKILLEKRAMDSMPPSVIAAMEMITLDPEHPPIVVGSYKYVIHEYPVDIDLFENCEYVGASPVPIVNRLVSLFGKMAERIQKAKLTYLSDFKAGEDKRFICPFLGSYDVLKKHTIGYDAVSVRAWIHDLESLISPEEKRKMLAMVKDKPTYFQYVKLTDAIRSHWTIRWDLKEIKRGWKKLVGGVRYTLAEALQSQSVVKIDIVTPIDQRFVEVTNWFRIRYRETKKRRWMEWTQPLEVYEDSIRKGVRDFFDPNLKKNMKMAKRIWLYAVHKNDVQMMKDLYPLFQSHASRLGQLRGEIDVLIHLLENKKPPIKNILNQIIMFNDTISTVTQNILPTTIKQQIFRRIHQFYDLSQPHSIKDILKTLHFIDKKLNQYIQRYVYAFLKKKHIFSRIEKIFAIPSPKATVTGYVLTA